MLRRFALAVGLLFVVSQANAQESDKQIAIKTLQGKVNTLNVNDRDNVKKPNILGIPKTKTKPKSKNKSR